MIGKQSLLFPILRDEYGNDIVELSRFGSRNRRKTEQRQFDVDIGN
jgi:hypothetical protein